MIRRRRFALPLVGTLLLVATTATLLFAVTTPVSAAPATVNFEANEPGLRILIDGEVHITPFQLETDDTTTHTIYAPGTQTSDGGETMRFVGWSDGGAQEHVITPVGGTTITVNYEVYATAPSFENGFEEGNLSAYPQPNIDIRPGATLEVTTNHPRLGEYSAEVNTDGTGDTTTAVFDWVFPKQNTVYVTTHISLPPEFVLQPGEAYNAITLKNEVYARKLYLSLGADYRIEPVFFDVADQGTFAGPVGPVIPRDGSWHKVQVRYTVDEVHGAMELWLDDQKIAEYYDINTGLAGTDDIGVATWGPFFSSASVVTKIFYDDLRVSDSYINPTIDGFEIATVVDGLNVPTYATFAPDGRIFIAEKDGTIRVVEDGVLLPDPVVVIPNVNTYQDRGLLSIALDPNFATNGYLYAAYTYEIDPTNFEGDKTAELARFTVVGNTASLASKVVILGSVHGTPAAPSCDAYPIGSDCLPSDARTHTIGDMRFLPDGTLLVTQGEGAYDQFVNDKALRAQNLDSLGGKVLHINPDGTGVATNPFFNGDPNATRSKVYALGLRNSFRFGLSPTGTIFGGDVGWGDWEEVNVLRPGQNYGWPCYEGNIVVPGYDAYPVCQALVAAGTASPPLYTYPHPPTSATVGGAFYTGTAYPAQYQGAYFFGDYGQSKMWTLRVDESDELIPGSVEELPIEPDGPVQIFAGPNGDIYFISIFTGTLRRLIYSSEGGPPQVQITADVTSGPLPLSVNFSSAGTLDPEGGALTFNWDFGDGNTSTTPNPTHVYTTAGTYVATVTATDNQNISRSASVTITAGNTAPEVEILTPTPEFEFTVGDTVFFTAGGDDAEDGALTGEALRWRVLVRHCELTTNTCHYHPLVSGTGAAGSFIAPDHGHGTHLELRYTAVDSQGLASPEQILPIYPREVELTLDSNHPGTRVVLNGEVLTTPATVPVLANGTNSLFAQSPQDVDGTTYEFTSWSDGGAQNHDVVLTEAGTITATFTQGSVQSRYWQSYKIETAEGPPQATVLDDGGNLAASLELYESTNVDGVAQGALLDTYAPGVHSEGINKVNRYWTRTPGDFGEYPYVGKSTVDRGLDAGETSPPAPTGSLVRDLQLHPPESDRLTVAAFVVPEAGEYSVYNLASRKVFPWGGAVSYKVFDDAGTLIATIANAGPGWTTDATTYELGALAAGDKIYFAVDREESYAADAIEVAWTIRQVRTTDPGAPTVDSFSATPGTIPAGGSSTLSWTTSGATTVSIDNAVGTVAASGTVVVSPAATTTYTLTATGPGGTDTATVTVTVGAATTDQVWNSYDIALSTTSAVATVAGSGGAATANVELYESTDAGGVTQAGLLDTYRPAHAQTFNNMGGFWTRAVGDFGDYPYIGKSTVARGMDFGEAGAPPAPADTFDLQMHPPETDRLIVAAFVAPEPGSYEVSGLAARRVIPWSTDPAAYKVFDQTGTLIAEIAAGSPTWTTDTGTYDLGALAAGQKIYFAVDREGSYVGDAIELTWTITRTDGGGGPSAPTVDSFSATPGTIPAGGSSTLSWTTSGATTVSIDNAVGTVAASGTVVVSPAATTTYTLTATGPGGTDTATVTVTVGAATTDQVWNSYDIALSTTSAVATVAGSGGAATANVELYESTDAGGVTQAGLLDTYRPAHAQTFNNMGGFWTRAVGDFGDYPYIGKSTVARGMDFGEAGAPPAPADTFDLQMHPPETDRLIVAAFVAPEPGSYEVSGLAARRVIPWSTDPAAYKVFDQTGTLIAEIAAGSPTWTTDTGTYDLGALAAGQKIYFAVDREGSYVGDAIEITWTITRTDGGGGPSAPTVDSFSATPGTIPAGGSSTLSWTTSGATTVSIDNAVGTVAASGTVVVSPAATTTYTLTATGPGGTDTATVTVTVGAATTDQVWNSYDIALSTTSAVATVAGSGGAATANVELYESTDAGGVTQAGLLDTYRPAHAQTFNNMGGFWTRAVGDFGDYPYIGKSTVARGMDFGEAGAPPAPADTFDLQMHPPETDRLIVAAFVAPEAGSYEVSGLAARRVIPWSTDPAAYKVFDQTGTLIAEIAAGSPTWTTDTGTYDLGALAAGQKIYFAVDREGSYVGDAIEITWTITRTGA